MKTRMMNLRKLSVFAIAALLVTGISGLSTVAGMPKGETTSTPLVNPITALINTVGDDLFSTLDLTTLVDPTTSATPTTHYGPYAYHMRAVRPILEPVETTGLTTPLTGTSQSSQKQAGSQSSSSSRTGAS